jgi:hypothetical protein
VQIVSVVVSQYGVIFPPEVKVVVRAWSWINFDVFNFVRLGCGAAALDQFNRLMIITCIPLLVVAAALALHAVIRYNNNFIKEDKLRKRWQQRTFAFALLAMFLVLPGVRARF